jgi:glycosyltransferase involved in cell wall biosynthesis
MNSGMPLVSIIIPCYNAEEDIGRSVQSALAQSYANVEVTVIDDGSTDGSLAVIRSFGDKIRWETGPNRGGCAARNRGIALARGELIQLLDADDTLHANKLEVQVPAALQCRPQVSYCDAEQILLTGQRQVIAYRPPPDDPVELMLRTVVLVSSPLHWKTYLEAVGGFRTHLPCCQEWDLHLRLACNGVGFHHLGGVHYTIHRRAGSVADNDLRVSLLRMGVVQDAYEELKTAGTLTDKRAKIFAIRMARDGLKLLRFGREAEAANCFEWAARMHRSAGITADYGSWTVRRIHQVFGPKAVLSLPAWRSNLIRRCLGTAALHQARGWRGKLLGPPPTVFPSVKDMFF